MANATSHLWPSPIFFGKIPNKRGVIEVPPAVTTLDPAKISGENFFDISTSSLNDRRDFRRISSIQRADAHSRQYGNHMDMSFCPFHPDTKGFLYYCSVPNQNPLGGGLRFRVAKSPDQHGFLTGHDLVMDHGLPWQIPIWQLCTRRAYRKLLAVLKVEGFAPPEMGLTCEKMHIADDSVLVTALGQPWTVDWSWEFSRIYLVTPGRNPVPTLVHMPWFQRSSLFPTPFMGRGIVSIITRDNGTFGLRVDKILQLRHNVVNVNAIVPEEGTVTEFRGSLILKQTKMPDAKRMLLVDVVNAACRHLPWAPANPNPLEVFRHYRLPSEKLRALGFANSDGAPAPFKGQVPTRVFTKY